MTEKKPSRAKAFTSQFSAEAIAAGGGILGLITLLLLIYQNYLMSDQTAEMIATNKEMIHQRKMQEKERYNHLLEVLYDSKNDKPVYKTSYNREIKESRYNFKIRTEAFHEAAEYLLRVERSLDFSGGLLGESIDFRQNSFTDLNLNKADLRNAILTKAVFSNAQMANCDFYEADLRQTDLNKANLKSAVFSRADLTGARLTHTKLEGALFIKTQMNGTDLSGADLRGAVFVDVDLSSTDLTETLYDLETQWPENFDLIATDLKFKMKLKKTEPQPVK